MCRCILSVGGDRSGFGFVTGLVSPRRLGGGLALRPGHRSTAPDGLPRRSRHPGEGSICVFD